MSTLKVSNIQQADAPAPNITLSSDGSVTIPSLAVALDALSDVEIDTIDADDLLVYDGSEWRNASPEDVVNDAADARIAAASLNDIGDVNAPAPDVNETLAWDGSAWQTTGVATELDGLSDVNISLPEEGQALVYNGSEWVAQAFPAVNLRNADVVVRVGPNEDTQTINEALEFLSTLRVRYEKASPEPIRGLIRLSDDFVMEEQVLVDGQDFSWVTILSDAGSDPVSIVTFEEGEFLPGLAQPQISEVTVGSSVVGSDLDNHYVVVDDNDGSTIYFWFQVLRFAETTVQGRVKVVSDTPGPSDLSVVTQIGSSPGDPLVAEMVGDDIVVTLATINDNVQASGLLFSDDGGIVSVTADAEGPFDGTDGNLNTEIVDTGSGDLSVAVDNGTLTVDFGGEASVTSSVLASAIDDIAGLSATEDTAGTFTSAEDLGSQSPLGGGVDAGSLDSAQNTSSLVASAIDGVSGVSASAVASGSVSVEDTFPLTDGEGVSVDPTPSGDVSVEIEIDVTTSAIDAAADLRAAVDDQAGLSAFVGQTGRTVTFENVADGVGTTTLVVGGGLSTSTVQEGQDDGFQTKVNAPGHELSDGDLVTIRGHVGTVQEVDYNGRWTVVESDQGAGTFELDFASDPRALFSAVRAGVPDTAEVVLPENVPVSRAALTQVFEFFYFPAFGVARGTLPTIGCVFEMDETGPNPYISYKDGLSATDQGRINILPFAGFVNAGGANIYATRSSIINANDAVADGAKGNGIWAYSTSLINARRASATNCGSNGAGEDVGGGFDVDGLPVGSAVLAERGSIINAEGVDASGSTSSAFLAQYGGQVNVGADPGLAQGSGSSSLGQEFEARGGLIFGVNGDSQGWIAPPTVAMERVVVDDDTTVTLADRGMVIALDSEDPHTVTVPLDATLLLPVGTIVNVYRAGDGDVEVVGEAGVTVRNAGSISEQFGEVSLRKRAANEWVLVGEVDEP